MVLTSTISDSSWRILCSLCSSCPILSSSSIISCVLHNNSILILSRKKTSTVPVVAAALPLALPRSNCHSALLPQGPEMWNMVIKWTNNQCVHLSFSLCSFPLHPLEVVQSLHVMRTSFDVQIYNFELKTFCQNRDPILVKTDLAGVQMGTVWKVDVCRRSAIKLQQLGRRSYEG